MSDVPEYEIEPWRRDHDVAEFSCGVLALDRYLKKQTAWDMVSKSSVVFVLTESGSRVVRAYYSLSSLGIVFAHLPEKVRKKLPRYPQVSATLLGRLAVDTNYSKEVFRSTGKKARLGELMLVDAQRKVLQGASSISGSALLVIDVPRPTNDELKLGIRDPIGFYKQYGFLAFPGDARRVFKTIDYFFAATGSRFSSSVQY